MPVHIVVLFIVTVCHCIHYIVQCKRCKPRSQDTAQPKKEDVTFKRELDIFSHWFGVSDDQQSLIEEIERQIRQIETKENISIPPTKGCVLIKIVM